MRQYAKFWYDTVSKLKGNVALYAWRLLPRKKSSRMYVIAGGGLFAVILGISVLVGGSSPDEKSQQLGTFVVREGDLNVTVTESGSIKATKAVDIKSEVEGQATIVSIVKEGTFIQPADVNNKVLVEFDASDLKEKCTQQEITFASSKSSYTEATEDLDIQKNQNDSDISKSELSLHFALLDLQKFLGETVTAKLFGLSKNQSDPNCDVASLIDDPNIGGGALQQLRDLQSKIELASAELKHAQSELGWTQKLYEKKYVAGDDLEKDRLTEKSDKIALDSAVTALDLFKRYDFPKQARQLFSNYIEAGRELERSKAQARAKLAQAQAKLDSAKATYDLQDDRLDKLKKQLAACVIKAPASGLVVYQAGSRMFGGSQNAIEPGATIYYRQSILSLPNTAEMSVEIKVHESVVDKVRPGLPAKIVIDAFPDKVFTGKVIKVAPLPDQQNSWLNPDLKVYISEVSIDGTYGFLKPGMSAKVEIMVDQLMAVTYVPVQAVCNQGGKKLCYLAGEPPKPMTVVTGASNDSFVQITDGLSAGQTVLLNPPVMAQADRLPDQGKPAKPPASTKPAEVKKVAASNALPARVGE